MYPQRSPSKEDAEFAGLLLEHPVFEAWARTGSTPTIRRSDLLSSREWHRQALYQNIYKRWACEDSMPVGLPAPAGLIACLCSERDIDFTETERDLVDLVRPHIVQMYRSAEMLSMLADASPSGGARTIMLDRDGRPLLATQTAWDLMATYFPGHSTLAPVFPAPVGSWLQAQLTRFDRASELPVPGAPLVVSKDGHGRLTLRLILGERTGEQALLVLEERRETAPASVLPRFGLSLREEEILSLLRLGKPSREIADTLFVSRRTVEKHLENIYCKLGVENRTAAVMVAYSGDQER